jgi:type VI secretion system secreted protein Hcp
MALTSYLTLEGEKQGQMKGDCVQKGREDKILVYAVEHSVEIPRDPLSGLPTGQRVHKPFTITKHVDPASPLLYQACTTGEHLKKWDLEYFTIDKTGKETLYYQVSLEDAIVVAIRHYKPVVFLAENGPYKDMEDISFTYSKITWSNKLANTEAVDDWKQPNA